MDLASKKLPLILIGILLVILAAQMIAGGPAERFIDPATCEIWIKGPAPAGRQYLDEFDPKCMELRGLNP